MSSRQNSQFTDETAFSVVIGCATVMEEITPLLPPTVSYQVLDFGLHVNPRELRMSLQYAINNLTYRVRNIILGYGLCSQAILGLKAEYSRLIIPKIDDCIAIFLGSGAAYSRQQKNVPGTYYLTKGWMKTALTPFDEFEEIVRKYGISKAHRIMEQILKNYTRLAFINTGSKLETYHEKARNIAQRFSLQYEEIEGSNALAKKMIYGPWDSDFIIAEPREMITFGHFRSF